MLIGYCHTRLETDRFLLSSTTLIRISPPTLRRASFLMPNRLPDMEDEPHHCNAGCNVPPQSECASFRRLRLRPIYIDPPAVEAVLSKRFAIAGQLLKGHPIEFETEGGARLRFADGRRVIELLASGVLGTEVGRLIEVAATGDTRLALRMTRQFFLQYGYSSSGRAMEIFHKTGRYNLPAHEALRAIMFGNQQIYNDDFQR